MTSLSGRSIVVADYDPQWPVRFARERDLILRACGPHAFIAIEHVGSTAVPRLGAKPIIDIMPGLRSLDDAPPLIAKLATIGYEYVPEYEQPTPPFDSGLPERRYCRKDANGERAFHLHMVETASEFWARHLLFRDYLRAHPEAAREYARLKRELAARFGADRVGYTNAKTGFITGIEAKARAAARR